MFHQPTAGRVSISLAIEINDPYRTPELVSKVDGERRATVQGATRENQRGIGIPYVPSRPLRVGLGRLA